jgi:hypothetical protein
MRNRDEEFDVIVVSFDLAGEVSAIRARCWRYCILICFAGGIQITRNTGATFEYLE